MARSFCDLDLTAGGGVPLSYAMRTLLCLAAILLAPSVQAQSIAASGRVEAIGTGGSCSGALIRPNIVVTAAHCISPQDASLMRFRVGDGRTRPMYMVERAIPHPLYEERGLAEWKLRFDIAILELKASVPPDRAIPIPPGREARLGEDLLVISWRPGVSKLPQQKKCQVIQGTTGLVTLGCPVQAGESGAPVVRQTENGLELVAIISSKARQFDQPIAQASDVHLRLPPLLDALAGRP